MMENWCGLVTDHESNERFKEAVKELVDITGTVSEVYEIKEWPPLTVGVINGKLCMSSDMFRQAKLDLGEIIPESN